MKRDLLRTAGVSLLTLLAISPAQAADRQTATTERLKPETVQAIQDLSQNLLTAKHSETPAPELQQLRQRVNELRSAVQKLKEAQLTSVIAGTIILGDITTAQKQLADKERERHLKHEKLEQDVHSALNKVRHQRSTIETLNRDDLKEQHKDHLHRVAAKVQELEDELEKAMTGQPEEQAEKLEKLQQKLTLHGKPEQKDAHLETPTLSTIVRHRE